MTKTVRFSDEAYQKILKESKEKGNLIGKTASSMILKSLKFHEIDEKAPKYLSLYICLSPFFYLRYFKDKFEKIIKGVTKWMK